VTRGSSESDGDCAVVGRGAMATVSTRTHHIRELISILLARSVWIEPSPISVI
jgi:hypothetical protein